MSQFEEELEDLRRKRAEHGGGKDEPGREMQCGSQARTNAVSHGAVVSFSPEIKHGPVAKRKLSVERVRAMRVLLKAGG